jgi:maleate cis-trans isomerase
MYGWRGRIGLIIPASNTTCEVELAKLCPEGVATASSRIMFEPTVAGLRRMVQSVERAATELACERISDLIMFCCTVGSMIEGPEHDTKIIGMIEEKTGIRATTTTTAVIQALRHLGVRRLAVATPYTADINAIEASALESFGFEVTCIDSVYKDVLPRDFRNTMIAECTDSQVYRLARGVDSPEADAIFLSCVNLPAIDLIECLESDCGKPVVSSNQASMWQALRLLGIGGGVRGFGRLLAPDAQANER